MAGYIGTGAVPQATQKRDSFTATAGQTSFPTSGYTPGFVDVYMNGVKLAPADFTATNSSDVVLAVAAVANDTLEIISYSTFDVSAQTFTGDVTASGGTFLPTGDTSAGDAAAMGYAAADGLVLTGQGSTSDVTIKNDADATVMSIPTGTTGVTFSGSVTATGASVGALARGAIQVGNSSGVSAPLVAGGADTVLTSDGTDISWAAASSGYRTLLSTTTISDDATVLITGLDSTYSEYQFVITDLLSNDSDGYPLRMRVQANSAIDSTAGNYRFSVITGNSNSTTVSNGVSGTNHDHIDLNAAMDSASPDTSYLVFNIINPSGTTNSVRGYGRFADMYDGVLYQGPMAFSYNPVTYAVTGLQFYNPGSSGTLKSGTIKLYGIS